MATRAVGRGAVGTFPLPAGSFSGDDPGAPPTPDNLRATQLGTETAIEHANLRDTQLGIEVATTASAMRDTQLGIEVAIRNAGMRDTQLGIEVAAPPASDLTVGGITDTSATGTLTTRYEDVLQTRWQLYTASPFALVLDTTAPGFTRTFLGLTPATGYLLRALPEVLAGPTRWTRMVAFSTLATPPPPPPLRGFVEPEFLEPVAGPVRVRVRIPAGASTWDLWISADLGSSWVLIASGITGQLYTLDSTLYANGIDYRLRADFDTGDVVHHPGFKIANGNLVDHVFVPVGGFQAGGSASFGRYWDTSIAPYPTPDGLAAFVGVHFLADEAALVPPQSRYHADVDLGTKFRVGTLSLGGKTGSLGQAQAYLTAGGQSFGVAAFVSGTKAGGDQRGILAAVEMGMLWPWQPCPYEGKSTALSQFVVRVANTPGDPLNVVLAADLDGYDLWAVGPGKCAPNSGLVEVRARFVRLSPTQMWVRAGIAGYSGTPYWLIDDVVDFDDTAAPDDCGAPGQGNCGWGGYRIQGATWGNPGFRSGESFAQTNLATSLPDCPPITPEPACPPQTLEAEFFGRRGEFSQGTGGTGGAPPPPPSIQPLWGEVLWGESLWGNDTGYPPPSPPSIFGGNAALLIARDIFTDHGDDYLCILQPAEVFPAGPAGEALFTAIYLTIEQLLATSFTVVPILNGKRLPPIIVNVPVRSLTDEPDVFRVEIPLVQDHSGGDFLAGLRGTYFTFELTVVGSVAGQGFAVLEADLQVQVLRESQPGQYHGQMLTPALCTVPEAEFWGTAEDNAVGRDGADGQDFGVDFVTRLYGHAVMPAGAAGEAMFPHLYLLTTRNNALDVTVTVTPYLDTYPMPARTLVLPGVADPVSDVHEMELDFTHISNLVVRSLYAPRGARLAFRFEVLGAQGGDIIFEHVELSVQTLRESQEAVRG